MAKQIFIIIFVLSVCAWQADAVVNCTATGAGRQADPDDLTCKNYTLCIYSSATASYLSYNYVCPTTSLFNPILSQCTANYVCNATAAVANTTACTADGFIADPTSTNCSSYLQCVQINDTFIETTFTCPTGTFYNPTTTLCVTDYVCPTEFTCNTAGRFANAADTTCQTYYYCVLLADATYSQLNYTCPSTSVFSPLTSLCTSTYTCPG